MITITKALPVQAGVIRDLAERTWWKAYGDILSEEQIRYMLDTIYDETSIRKQLEGDHVYLLLLEEGSPVAFADYGPREEDQEVYKLHKIYCLPETQGKGYGRMLMEEVSKRVIKAGKQVLELNVNRHNKAKRFYEKMGFSVAYQEDIPIGEFFMNDYVMRKKLF